MTLTTGAALNSCASFFRFRPSSIARRIAIKDPCSHAPLHSRNTAEALPSPALPASSRSIKAAVRASAGEYTSRSSSSSMSLQGARPSVVDSHLHVWASEEESPLFPYHPGQEPAIPGHVETLVKCMSAAGVQAAVITQPINHKFDHSYVTNALRLHPHLFIGSCLADPSQGGGGKREMRRLVEEDGYQCVRFNPYLWPEGEKMTNPVGVAMFAAAGQLGVPVAFMCFKGFHLHVDEIESLCSLHPDTAVIIDHFGFCRPPKHAQDSEMDKSTWERLLQLSHFPQVHVKASAHFRVSRESYPYTDTWLQLRQLIDSFGANRILWGSDFPFIQNECGYDKCWELLRSESLGLTEDERAWIQGKTAATLFKNGWKQNDTQAD